LVFDIGASTTRCGYAGDDTPKSVFPTSYGYVSQTDSSTIRGPDEMVTEETKVVRYFGEQGPAMWRNNMEVTSPIKDGLSELILCYLIRLLLIACLVNDFDPVPSMVSHAIEKSLGCDPREHPVIVTEPTWNTPAHRERMAEIMFEQFKVPAFYIANTGVLNA
jgi:actin-like protein 6B